VNSKRRSLLLIVLALLVATFAFAPQASSLTLKQRLAAVQKKLSVFYKQMDMAVEKYNEANSQLQTVKSKITSNEQLLKVTEYNLAVAHSTLNEQVVTSYKQHQVDFLDVILTTRSFDQLVTQLDALNRFSSQDTQIVASIKTAKQKVVDLRISLAADKQAATTLVTETKTKSDAVKALVAKEESIVHGLKAQIKAQEAAAARAAQLAAQAAQRGVYDSNTGSYNGPAVDPGGAGHPQAVAIAAKYLGVPYVWGGASPSGFDCSGLVMYVYSQLGISLPHGATAQQQMSKQVGLAFLLPGDLVFFGGPSYSYHVGIFVGGGTMIEAPHTGAVVRYGSISGAWTGGRF
jgi:peptidoglycan DL-endopeptidase CwlO